MYSNVCKVSEKFVILSSMMHRRYEVVLVSLVLLCHVYQVNSQTSTVPPSTKPYSNVVILAILILLGKSWAGNQTYLN